MVRRQRFVRLLDRVPVWLESAISATYAILRRAHMNAACPLNHND